MLERNVTVVALPVKNSFIYVSKSLSSLNNGVSVKLTLENGQTGYFSVGETTSNLKDNCIGLSSLYCKTLGIKENEDLLLSEIAPLPIINSITITPASESDYDIIESLAESVQSTLLDQIRVVFSGQKFVIWIGNNLNVTVIVDSVKPVSPGILGFLTEVHIEPCLEHFGQPSCFGDGLETIGKFQTIYEKLNFFQKKPSQVESEIDKFLNYKQDLVYRLVPIKNLPCHEEIKNYLKPCNIFVPRTNLLSSWSETNTKTQPVYGSLSLITNDVLANKIVFTRIFILDDLFKNREFESRKCIFVDDLIFNHFNCDLGTRVVLKVVDKIPIVTEINIHTKKNYLLNVEEEFKKYLKKYCDDHLVLNADIPFVIDNNIVCSLKFVPIEVRFVVVDHKFVESCKYFVIEEDVVLPTKGKGDVKSCDNSRYLEQLSNYSDIILGVTQIFGGDYEVFENILITGKPGTGKTTILDMITRKLETYPNFLYTKTINCRNFRGKTPDSLIRVFSDTFSMLILHQPSILMLDNLHILCENVPGDDSAPNSLYYNRISEMLHNFFKLFSEPNKIGICASIESTEKLNKNLYISRGSHLFKNLFTISELTKMDRLILLKHLFKIHYSDDINFEELSVKTEGFVTHDIVDFYNKTIFELHKADDDENTPAINQNHCNTALKNTCVLSLQNVSLHSPGEKDFADIGGLDDVKDTLVESLLWPAKYPNIFAKAPLRLQSGTLLYGPPGTGKTLLAAAAAKHCGLRLISVKGPELLSKYIGASEQAVRDIFQKAQSVRPCILFFDEFDSLAPRRGHDNTGVTDRVVNQLLTQLDGVESLTGVCVLAATSRPDLLDPALLRPGRLDRQLLCSLPNKNGRLAILTVLSKNLDLADDIDMEKIADHSEFFSGADLQSLLYTAQISTIEGLLNDNEVSQEYTKSKITQRHLADALAKTKPSLTQVERLKYERIYAKFQSASNIEDFKTGSKATLA